MTSIAYARVSTVGQTLQSQIEAVERAATAAGDVISTWFTEKASARTLRRPAMDRVREVIRGGGVKRLYCFRVDRLSRAGVAPTYALVSEIREAGVELVCVSDNLRIKPDGDDIASDALLFGLAIGARIERAAIGERVAAARARLASEGRPWGRPRRLTDQEVARAKSLRAAGKTLRQIAVLLRAPKTTCIRALGRNTPAPPPPRNPTQAAAVLVAVRKHKIGPSGGRP
ncbi:MAG: recombinase family protein [Anaeromyxobacter sp.]|nr:recombinase family protein [Anaeromyxobacter sp.]